MHLTEHASGHSNREGMSSSHPVDGSGEGGDAMMKLKPLHWDKVRASSDWAMVWNQMKSSSFQLNEDLFETLFVNNSANSVPKELNRPVLPPSRQENRVLDPKKAILLRALTVSRKEVTEALLNGEHLDHVSYIWDKGVLAWRDAFVFDVFEMIA